MSFVAISDISGKVLLHRAHELKNSNIVSEIVTKLAKKYDEHKDKALLEISDFKVFHQRLDRILIIYGNCEENSSDFHSLSLLKLLSSIVQRLCVNDLSEKSIIYSAFDIIFSFDEVMWMGFTELLSLDKIEEILKMESSNEIAHDLMIKV